MKIEDRLNEVIQFVEERTGTNIRAKARQPDVIDARALYYKIALKATRVSMKTIASVVNKDHSTVIHSRKNIFPILEEDSFYMRIYSDYFGETEVEEVLKTDSNEVLTNNEKAYRELSDEDRAVYDERAALVLKSFEWKRKDDNRKEVFEIINVSQ